MAKKASKPRAKTKATRQAQGAVESATDLARSQAPVFNETSSKLWKWLYEAEELGRLNIDVSPIRWRATGTPKDWMTRAVAFYEAVDVALEEVAEVVNRWEPTIIVSDPSGVPNVVEFPILRNAVRPDLIETVPAVFGTAHVAALFYVNHVVNELRGYYLALREFVPDWKDVHILQFQTTWGDCRPSTPTAIHALAARVQREAMFVLKYLQRIDLASPLPHHSPKLNPGIVTIEEVATRAGLERKAMKAEIIAEWGPPHHTSGRGGPNQQKKHYEWSKIRQKVASQFPKTDWPDTPPL